MVYLTLNTQLRYGTVEFWNISTAGLASSVTIMVTRSASKMDAASLHSRDTQEDARRSLTPRYEKRLTSV